MQRYSQGEYYSWSIPLIIKRTRWAIRLMEVGHPDPTCVMKDPTPLSPDEIIDATREALHAIGVLRSR